MKRTLIAVASLLALSTSASSLPVNSPGIWINPPGLIGQCFVCPDGVTSDCMDAEPVYLQVAHDGNVQTLHVTQLYPDAFSEETGLAYKGALALTVQNYPNNEAAVVVNVHWRRADGLDVQNQQHLRLLFTTVDGVTSI